MASRSKPYNKFDVLKYIFMKKTNNGSERIGENIDFTLPEIGEGIRATGGIPPTSWSNFVLDLTRKHNKIHNRLPQEIIAYGYDLRKKTGPVPGDAVNYCGTFVYRGFDANGNTIPIQDWLEWSEPDRIITIKNIVPKLVSDFISNDEASLFSVIDYCDILSIVLGKNVCRIQSPMKWQPNEIDGYYAAKTESEIYLYPIEAKAVSTADDINLVQMHGQYHTFINKYSSQIITYKENGINLIITPIAARMEHDGMLLAILNNNINYDTNPNGGAPMFDVVETVRVRLNPPLEAWR